MLEEQKNQPTAVAGAQEKPPPDTADTSTLSVQERDFIRSYRIADELSRARVRFLLGVDRDETA